ncbi:MAG TPA: carboxypeptidase regulatory-like domain-containing protein [Bryobacteraceae bacterium]|jgi:uncharacterized GH25 family protein|nr:carboxypeptidase regulatory-like domain-containing protein [Bryobacteraceae bacterium]
MLWAGERATITGKVLETSGTPVEHATIVVYEAGTKKGYSSYCPTCWVDCGKRTISDGKGDFTIRGLDPDLWFTLLVVHEGYSATYIKKVDPAEGTAHDAVLTPRPQINDVSQVVRGTVVNPYGHPIRYALVEQEGVTVPGKNGEPGFTGFGPRGWIDEMVATNEKGEFEIAYSKPAVRMILQVSARGMAPKLFTETTGGERKTLALAEGAVIRGRLIQNGKPVANAEVGLVTHDRMSGAMFPEMRVGTREDGTFVFTNVPAGRIWVLYPKMESLASRDIGADVVLCETKDNGQEVDVGDISLKPAYRLKGRVTLSDGKTIPPDMHVTLSADRAWDSQIVPIKADGSFEFDGLPSSVYSVSPGVRGYHLEAGFGLEVLVNRDVNDFSAPMQIGNR